MPPLPIRIERLTYQDAQAYHKLRLAALREAPSAFATSEAEEATTPLEDVATRFVGSPGRERFVIAARGTDNQLVGTCGFYRQPGDKSAHIGWVWGIYVVAPARRQGIAAQVLKAAMGPAREIPGLCQVQARVGVQNIAARKLLESAGFEFVAVLPRAIRLGTRFVDEALMLLRTDGQGSLAGPS